MSGKCDGENGDHQNRDPLEMGMLLSGKDLTITTEKSTTDIAATSETQQVSYNFI